MSDSPQKRLGISCESWAIAYHLRFVAIGFGFLLLMPIYATILNYVRDGVITGALDRDRVSPFFEPQYRWLCSNCGELAAITSLVIGLSFIAGSLVAWRINARPRHFPSPNASRDVPPASP